MVANTPGILPKTALVGSRAIYYPFTIPQKLTDSSYAVGKAGAGMVEGINAAVGNAYMSLEPRGPAKWLLPLFQKIDAAAKDNARIADRNKTVFWDPVSQGAEGIGRAFAGPGAYWYLRKAGIEQPTTENIKGVLNMSLFRFPAAGEVPGGAPAPPAETPPVEETPPAESTPPTDPAGEAAAQAAAAQAAAQAAAEQAAEGAGQVAA